MCVCVCVGQGPLREAKDRDGVSMPAYFRFLTLLGLRIFLQAVRTFCLVRLERTFMVSHPPSLFISCCRCFQNVQVVVLEVGLGGRLDATNVIERPMVCGITSIGYDHVEVLGNTLTQIAQEKAGILKAGVKAYTAPQVWRAFESTL